MANIASQKKRIQRTERERLENRRRVSQVKTWFRRLQDAVDAGDAARVDEEYRALESRIAPAGEAGGSRARESRRARAVNPGARQKTPGARRKARAARLRANVPA